MTTSLARLVAHANIQSLSLIGLAKNVGKTTTTNYLLETLLSEGFYDAEEVALTSLGLDGEATDALTGLPKPRYIPQAGLLIVTTNELLHQAEYSGARFEFLQQLPGRTALGLVSLARVIQPGRVVIAGPTLLRDLRHALDQLHAHDARLGIIDGAINRLGAAAPHVTDACIVCTGASVAATPELVAHRTADILARLTTAQTALRDVYKNILPGSIKRHSQTRLVSCHLDYPNAVPDSFLSPSQAASDPSTEAQWITEQLHPPHQKRAFFLQGALTEELSRELLMRLPQPSPEQQVELVVGDATKLFCHSVALQRLAARGMLVRVAEPIRMLAITINPYTLEYTCTSQRLLDALNRALPSERPPIIDIVSGLQG